ncbi:MAG: hypothetical protein GWO04_41510, partial [Actinobacteria bacterium]|nr:hypothetical protein [Actinomycetota bacterium]
MRYDPRQLAAWFRERDLTMGWMPTVMTDLVLTEMGRRVDPLGGSGGKHGSLGGSGFTHLFTGGDRLRNFVPADMGCALFNQYGPSEATVIVVSGRV